jgi:type VII secretion protein EccE
MKAQFPFGLAVSWPRITTVFLVDVALLAIASHCPDAWQAGHAAFWVGVALATVVTIAAMLTYRGIPLASAPFARIRNWYADPEALTVGCTTPIDHRRRSSRDTVGVREYEGRLVAVIAVDGPGEVLSGRYRNREVSAATIPLEAVAAALCQFDVGLDGIDIVSVGTRLGPQGHKDGGTPIDFGGFGSFEGYGGYGNPVDEHRPPDERSTWLVLRMDPQHNVAAVAARESVACTLAAVTERLVHDLDGRSCAARILTADEIIDVDDAVLAGLQPAQVRPFWRYLRTPDGYVTSFWVSPQDITGETMEELWISDADVTVVTIRLIVRGDGADVSTWVRHHSDKRLRKEVWSGLNRLTGRQLGAVAASLPAPASGRPLAMPSRPLGDGENIWIPVGAVPTVPVMPEQQMSPVDMMR